MVQLFVREPNGSTLVLDVDLFDTGLDRLTAGRDGIQLRITGGPCEICARNTGVADDGERSRRSGRTYLFFAPQ